MRLLSNKAASLMEQNNRLAYLLEIFGSLGLLLRYLATSGAKSDIIFLLDDSDFL